MRRIAIAAAALGMAAGFPAAEAAGGRLRLGLSATAWTAVGDLDISGVDRSGIGYALSLQYRPPLVGWQLDLERLPDRFGADAYAPQGYLVLGRGIYAAGGAGWTYRDGSFADEPFLALKAGLETELLPGLFLDLFGCYRFRERMDLRDEERGVNKSTVFLGAAVRLRL